MAFGGALLVRIGARRLLIGALLAWTVRLLLYSLIVIPMWLLPMQLLHGPTYAAMWIAGVAYAKHLAPERARAAAQGLFTGVMVGLGGFMGGLLGGVLYEWLGPAWLFQITAVLTLLGAILLVLSRAGAHQA